VEPLGSETLLHWRSAAGTHVSRATGSDVPGVGMKAMLAANPDRLLLFDSTTGASLLDSRPANPAR
jgi:hypothetical protein